MGLRVPFALVPFGFNSPIKFIIYVGCDLFSLNVATIKR